MLCDGGGDEICDGHWVFQLLYSQILENKGEENSVSFKRLRLFIICLLEAVSTTVIVIKMNLCCAIPKL